MLVRLAWRQQQRQCLTPMHAAVCVRAMANSAASTSLLARLEEVAKKAEMGGGEQRVAKQHEKGKLTARERLTLLLDRASFREYDRFKTHRCYDFDMQTRVYPGDGVVTGQGTINGRPVFVFSQDFTVEGGSLSETHAEKICKVRVSGGMQHTRVCLLVVCLHHHHCHHCSSGELTCAVCVCGADHGRGSEGRCASDRAE